LNTDKIHIILNDITEINKLPDNHNIKIFIHLAALRFAENDDDYVKINVLGLKNILELAQKNSVETFVFLSSTSIFTGRKLKYNESYKNDFNYQARDAYGNSKIAAEKLIIDFKADFRKIIIRSAYINDNTDGYEEIIKKRLKKRRINFVVLNNKDCVWQFVRPITLIKTIETELFSNSNKNVVLIAAEQTPVKITEYYNSLADNLNCKHPIYLYYWQFVLLKVIYMFLQKLFFKRLNINNNILAEHLEIERFDLTERLTF